MKHLDKIPKEFVNLVGQDQTQLSKLQSTFNLIFYQPQITVWRITLVWLCLAI